MQKPQIKSEVLSNMEAINSNQFRTITTETVDSGDM